MKKVELYEYLRYKYPATAGSNRVRFLMNIFNGGLHALREGEKLGVDKISIQEIMINVAADSYQAALEMADKIYFLLSGVIQEKGCDPTMFGDEGGYAPPGIGDDCAAIDMVMKAIEKAGYAPGKDVFLSLDVAATSLYQGGKYEIGGKRRSVDEMLDFYRGLVKKYPICSIEDGFAEDDWKAWQKLRKEFGEKLVLIGDDIFVTNTALLRQGIEKKAANAILIKPNQIGTLTATMEAIQMAKEARWNWIISHRSGEVLDATIADIAFATGAWGLKAGAPFQRPSAAPAEDVRRTKYLRMIEMEVKAAKGERKIETPDIGITNIEARKIKDSRGNSTIKARVILENGVKGPWAAVPAGKSTGKGEAPVVSARQALKNIVQIRERIKRNKIVIGDEQNWLDGMLMHDIEKWGGNATLAISLAFAKAAAEVSTRD